MPYAESSVAMCTVQLPGRGRCKNRKASGSNRCPKHNKMWLKFGRLVDNAEMQRACRSGSCTELKCNRTGLCRRHYKEQRKDSPKSNLRGIPSWLRKWLDTQPCVICKWNRAPCDTHHIEPFNADTPEHSNRISNLLPLCPNHHREQQAGRITSRKLRALNKAWVATVPRTWPACPICGFRAISWRGQTSHNPACARSGGKPSRRTLGRRSKQ